MFRPRTLKPLFCVCLILLVTPLLINSVAGQTVQDEYNIASGYYARGEWDEAIESFKKVIELYPDTVQSAESHFFVGEAMMQNGDFAGAYKAFQGFLTKLPRHGFAPRATFRLGETAYRLKQYDQAIRLLEAFIVEYPNDQLNEFALPFLGELRLKKLEPQLAQKAYETALRAFPTSQLHNKCQLGLAKSLQMLGSTELAARMYKDIISDESNTLAGEARLQMGMLSYGNQDFELAKQLLEEARHVCAEEESQAEAGYWWARSELATSNPGRAVQIFAETIELTGNEKLASSILFDGALAAIQSDQDDVADKWLSQLQATWPTGPLADDALQMRIDLAQRDSRNDDAIVLIEEFVESYSDSPLLSRVQEVQGRIYYQQSKFQDSVDAFTRLLESGRNPTDGLKSSNRETWKYLQALGLIGLKRLPEAETALTSINLEGQTPRLRALVEIARATTYSGLQKIEKAVPCYQNYLSLEPDGSEAGRAQAELTIALAKLEKWVDANDTLIKLQQNHSDRSALILDTARYLAESAFAAKQNQFAIQWYQILAQPGNPKESIARGLSGIAWIKMRSKDFDGASESFERLLKENPDSEFAAEAAMAQAKFLDDAEQYEQAAEMYGFVIDRLKDSKLAEAATLRRAYTLQQLAGRENLLQAEKLLTDYLQLPGKPAALDEAIYQLGWIYHDLDDAQKGLEKFDVIVRDYPRSKYWPDAAYRLVQDYVHEKDFEQAMPLMTRLIDSQTPVEILSRVIFLQGQIAAEQDQWEMVTDSMRALVEKTDDRGLYAKANYWLAESLYRQDNFDEAGDLFQRLLEKIRDLDESLAPWIYLRAAQCNVQEEHWTEALLLAESAKEEFTSFDVAYEYDFIRGRAYAAQGKFDYAVDAFRRVIESKTGGDTETAAIAQWRIGEVYFHQENYPDAIQAYYRVDSLFAYPKWRAAALMQAGKCQEHLGNWKHAARLYKQLIADFPDSEFRVAAEDRLAFAVRQASASENETSGKTRR